MSRYKGDKTRANPRETAIPDMIEANLFNYK